MSTIDRDILIKKYINPDIEKFHNSDVKIVLENLKQNILKMPSADRPREWILCSERLPNEDEISYDGIGWEGKRDVSDRILAIDRNGFIRTGYFISAMDTPKFGKRYEFGEHYQNDLTNWIVGETCRKFDPIAWMPLPESWKGAYDE